MKPIDGKAWCATCGGRHAKRDDCPGELVASGPERPGARISAVTPQGIEGYVVLVAPSADLWRARILTTPNVLWLAPGSQTSLKFVGGTAREAESRALEFIRTHCASRGYELRPQAGQRHDARVQGGAPAPRKIRFLPIRFGVTRPSEQGGTGDLSATGVFIMTDAPMEIGTPLIMTLGMGDYVTELKGQVRWMRKQHHVGRSPGMGVQLVSPPLDYVEYIKSLS